MARKDVYHDTVVKALQADGWSITDDPLTVSFGDKNLFIDLGAEKLIGAKKGHQQIAVEIKSFLSPSDINDLESAVGQFNLYRDILSEIESDRILYLAIPERAYDGIFSSPIGQLIIEKQELRLIVFDDESERIIRWLP